MDAVVTPASSRATGNLAVGAQGAKAWISHIAALLMAVVFLASGGYKLLMPLDAAERLTQALIPGNLSVLSAVSLAVFETFAAFMLLIPKYRRFGAFLMLGMLVAFCIYIGVNFERLQGEDCGCFPWIKRAVGPVFFISNGVMIALAALAGLWSPVAGSWWFPYPAARSAVIFSALLAVALGSVTVAQSRVQGVPTPDALQVDGQPFSLKEGRTFLFLFDPECSHCLQSAKMLAEWNWGDTRVLVVPTINPQWAPDFLQATGLKAGVAGAPEDVAALRERFEFVSPPYGIAVNRGTAQITVRYAEFEPALREQLAKAGFVKGEAE